MDALCKCRFIIIETILNIEHEDLTCFKGHICFSKNLFMSNRYMKKEIPGSPYFSVFALRNVLTQTFLHFHRTGQLTSSEHAKWTYIIYYYICFPLCAQILYFDAAKFSIKQFSLIYFTVSVVRQRNEYEIVNGTRPIKTTEPALPSNMLICTKILISWIV